MPAFTGVLGTKDSQLGNFVLGKGPPVGADNTQSVVSSITVSQTIRSSPIPASVSHAVAVVSTANGRNDTNRQSVTDSVTVTQVIDAVASPYLRVTQQVVEVFYQTNPPARITQYVVEVFYRKAQLNSVTDTVTVTDTIDLPQRIVHITVSHSIATSQTEVGIDDHVRVTRSDAVAVATTIVPKGVNNQAVSHAVSVVSTPTGRNNIIRMSVTSSVTSTPSETDRDDTAHKSVSSTLNVTSTSAGRNTSIRLPISMIVTTTDTRGFRNTNPRKSAVDGINVTDTIHSTTPNFTVTSPITVLDAIAFRSTVVRKTVTNSIAVATTAHGQNSNPRITVTDTVTIPFFPPQVGFRNTNNRQTVLAFVAVADTATPTNSNPRIAVTDSVAIGESIRSNQNIQRVSDTVILFHTVFGGDSNRVLTVSDAVVVEPLLAPANSNVRISMSNLLFIHTTATAQTPIVPITVTDNVHATLIPVMRLVQQQNVLQGVVVTSTAGLGVGTTRRQLMNDSVVVNQNMRISPVQITVTTPVTVTQKIRELEITVTSRVTVTQQVNKTADYAIVDTLTLTQDTLQPKTMTHSLVDTVPLDDVLDRSMIWGRDLFDSVVFPEDFFVRHTSIDPDPILEPVASGTIVPNTYLVLRTVPGGAITLPAPKFDDSEANVSSIIIKRSMNGETYSHIKSSDRKQLVWTFRISQAKAYELREWITKSISEPINITDWKGFRWLAKLTSNPFTLTAEGRFASEAESDTVELTFDAVRLG